MRRKILIPVLLVIMGGLVKAQQLPMYSQYMRLTEQGTKPPMAKLTLARRIAATVLAMWKNQEAYDPEKHRTKA